MQFLELVKMKFKQLLIIVLMNVLGISLRKMGMRSKKRIWLS